ncbi:MAG: histidine phosphatase family protein [Anaerolineales bacterium]|nr:histidine phosphatase family protein [Anaerolineales bacterium]
MTKIILVRHGQTEWNRNERFRGRADIPLNQTGLQQAEATGAWIAARWKPVAIYASPLSRAMQTAEAAARHFQLSVQPLPGIIDIDYGEWQGLSPDEARQRWPEQISHWYHAPEKAIIPGGETLQDLRSRLMETLKQVCNQYPHDTIMLVGHTVVNRIMLLGILGLGNDRFWRIKQDTCAINIIEWDGSDFTLASLNDTCHLRKS